MCSSSCLRIDRLGSITDQIPGDEVMMLSGEYVALNSHWEDWNLPKWYHPNHTLNMTTIARLNELARQARLGGVATERQEAGSLGNSSFSNATTNTVVPGPTATTTLPSDASPSLTNNLINPATVLPVPRFPEGHPISKELHELQNAAAVIHFSAAGKPWTVTEASLRSQRPDAHPLLREQFRTWRETAAMVCPGMSPSEAGFP